MALGLESPWEIKSVEFKSEKNIKELHIHISFTNGSKFKDETGVDCHVHDTQKRSWQHLNFFEHCCYLLCKVPKIKKTNSKVSLVEVLKE